MAFRFADESVIVDLPKFEAADSNVVSRAARASVCSDQCPMKCGRISTWLEFVEGHDHIRKCCHERLRFLGDRRASDRGWSVVHAQRTVLGMERRDTFRILAAPRLRITIREVIQLAHI